MAAVEFTLGIIAHLLRNVQKGNETMVDLKLILSGYDAAFNRLNTARAQAKESGNPYSLYIPLLETLGWADVIEEWLQEKHGKNWVTKLPPPAGELEEIVLGFRYARNVVHHRWAVAVELDDEPSILQDWRWKESLLSTWPQPTNEAAYKKRLANRALRHAFKDLHKLYGAAETHLSK